MSNLETILNRNEQFFKNFKEGDLPILPKLRTVIITCLDARVDPAFIFNLDLGECVVIRNTGGRITQDVVDQIAILAALVAVQASQMADASVASFDIIVMHHTQCGVQNFAQLKVQQMIKSQLGLDVAPLAITDHAISLTEDVQRLKDAPTVPKHLGVTGCIYDVKTGKVEEVIKAGKLSEILV
ncbi:hypothetical protein BKI52_16920 [marine bacterium AO1-C]|nr:hypothetical protein BKI52_16920 [marine bacterium AO1-C]